MQTFIPMTEEEVKQYQENQAKFLEDQKAAEEAALPARGPGRPAKDKDK